MLEEDIILKYLGPLRVFQQQWYDAGSVPAHSLAKEVTCTAKFAIPHGNIACNMRDAHSSIVVKTKNAPPLDMNARVTLWSIAIVGADNSKGEGDAFIACNHIPKAIAKHQELEDSMRAIYGMPKGAIELVKQGFSGKFPKSVFPLHSGKENAFLNPYWIKTMSLINEANLMNGIVSIPREVCELHPYVSNYIYKGSEEPPDGAIYNWYAIPPNHIMALYLKNFETWDWDKEGVPHPIPFKMSDGTVLFYLLPDGEVKELREQILHNWMPMIDRRPLGDLAFAATHGPIELDVALVYTTWPVQLTEAEINALYPIVPDNLKRTVE